MDRRDFIGKSAMVAGGALLSAAGVEALAHNNNGKTMKVLMINGSPHQKGNTAIALGEIAKQLEKNGIDSEIVWIGNSAVRGCIACGKCRRDPGKCAFDDDACNRISGKFTDADALIVGSPVYYGQPNGAVLSIIQRAFYSNGASISGKPAAAVAVCRRGGATASFETLNMPFQMMNMPVVTSQYWNIVYGAAPGQASLDSEGLQTMRTLANNMAWLLKATGGKPAPGRDGEPWEAMNFIR
jgi:multimeric flavodoxin WrbA